MLPNFRQLVLKVLHTPEDPGQTQIMEESLGLEPCQPQMKYLASLIMTRYVYNRGEMYHFCVSPVPLVRLDSGTMFEMVEQHEKSESPQEMCAKQSLAEGGSGLQRSEEGKALLTSQRLVAR